AGISAVHGPCRVPARRSVRDLGLSGLWISSSGGCPPPLLPALHGGPDPLGLRISRITPRDHAAKGVEGAGIIDSSETVLGGWLSPDDALIEGRLSGFEA